MSVTALAAFPASRHHWQRNNMMTGCLPIKPDRYVEIQLRVNPVGNGAGLLKRLHRAIAAAKRGERCQWGRPAWIIGSAESGLAGFTGITGEAQPDKDYAIEASELREDAARHA
jgi:hypothetical protein